MAFPLYAHFRFYQISWIVLYTYVIYFSPEGSHWGDREHADFTCQDSLKLNSRIRKLVFYKMLGRTA